MAALHTDVVRVQCFSRPGIEKPRVRRLPHQEQVVVALDVREPTPEVRPDTTLRVLLRERPELPGHEHPVTRMKLAVDRAGELLSERVQDRVPAHVVGMAQVVRLQFPVDLLNTGHSGTPPDG